MVFRRLSASSLLALALVGHALSVRAAEEAVLKLTAQQRQTAGVVLEEVRTAEQLNSNAQQGQLLPGRVVIPNERRDVILAGVSGRIEALLVNPGDAVRAGQPLVRLYSAELISLQRAFLSARSSQELAHKRLLRDEALFADGIISESRLQDSRDQALQAAAAEQEHSQLLQLAGLSAGDLAKLRGATDLTARVTLLASRGGRVLEQPQAVGSQVEAGSVLLQLAATDLVWLELQATREQLQRVAVGDSAEVTGCPLKGKVIAAGGQLDAATQTGLVRVAVSAPAQCLAPGQFVQASLLPSAAPAGSVSVGSEAVVQRGGKDYVFVEVEGGLRPVAVQVLRRQGAVTVLRSGVSAGTRVAGKGLAALKGSWMGLGAAAAGSD